MASTPKTMSNRLMTMKFMQRSASKTAKQDPATPTGPPSKKVRLSNGTSTPVTPDAPGPFDSPQTVGDAEERRRQEALDKAAEKAGESKWVLSFKDPNEGSKVAGMDVVHAGFAMLDAEDDSEVDEEAQPTRMRFGGGVKKENDKAFHSSDSSETDSDSDDFDSDDPTAELIRETKRETAARERESRRAANKTDDASRNRFSSAMNEDLDLGGLTSISGGSGGGGNRHNVNIDCFSCNQKGHRAQDCPKKRQSCSGGRARKAARGGRR